MEKSTLIRTLTLTGCIIGISLLHYLTPLQLHYLHDIFQRLYYLPIILAAFWFGLRGGLLCSIIVSIVYAPHILFQWGGHFTMEMERYMEILIYNTVGGVTGLLSQRERERSCELQKTAQGLKESYQTLQHQSEQIIVIEEQLRRAEKLSTLGEMAAMLAHEIRNPLGSIRGTAEILKDDYPPDDPKHEFIEIQIKETERLNRVVEDFLNMARPQPSDMKPCPVHEELETIVTLVSNDARERQVNIVLQPQPYPIIIKADREKLRQAFLNIIINALQATPPKGSVIISTVVSENTFCEISFQDSGQGIEEERLEKIFEPFFTTKNDGTGLGLAITKKIIESHNGTMRIQSKSGKGTIVTVSLPMQDATNGVRL
ncbi:MAG: ATP-binding protein [Chlorobiales bacterium]|nr:ATP-binding protein [Chlorobiales bacterium]